MTHSPLKALIIDDQLLIQQSLKKDIETYCHQVEVFHTASSVIEGIKVIQNGLPDIIFLDVELQDGDGFDLLDIVETKGIHIIFISGSREYAVKAFRYQAVDYLLKPIDPQQLIEAVDRVRKLINSNKKIINHVGNEFIGKKIILSTSEWIKWVELHQITRLEAEGNYTYFHLTHGEKILITRTLKEYDLMLNDKGFMRVHQSHLINKEHIQAYVKSEGGYLLMNDGSRIPVSTRKKQMVLEQLYRSF
ncbi:MAG TPA: LytTR family DNA-binding domain-containing protein [Saprospiraceae bacterium]|nr:LytTR family DNA-binding domain-containing protein [Saprospiraceae bacterium]